MTALIKITESLPKLESEEAKIAYIIRNKWLEIWIEEKIFKLYEEKEKI